MTDEHEKKSLLCDDNCQCGKSSGYCKHIDYECKSSCKCKITLQDCQNKTRKRTEGKFRCVVKFLLEWIKHFISITFNRFYCWCFIIIFVIMLSFIIYHFSIGIIIYFLRKTKFQGKKNHS